MALRNIREFGDPVLNKVCLPIKEMTDRNRELISDMFETMYEANGVGLAAPQVGILKQIVVIDVGMDEPEPLVLINPEIVEAKGESTDYEGCLSVPTIRGKVERYKEIEVTYYDESGIRVKKMVSGFTARDIQHECDHIDGIVFLDKVIPNGYATLDMIKQFELRKD